ncbi:MAG: hypothetical protein R3C03_19585 [Pirellulaceae bacterium]
MKKVCFFVTILLAIVTTSIWALQPQEKRAGNGYASQPQRQPLGTNPSGENADSEQPEWAFVFDDDTVILGSLEEDVVFEIEHEFGVAKCDLNSLVTFNRIPSPAEPDSTAVEQPSQTQTNNAPLPAVVADTSESATEDAPLDNIVIATLKGSFLRGKATLGEVKIKNSVGTLTVDGNRIVKACSRAGGFRQFEIATRKDGWMLGQADIRITRYHLNSDFIPGRHPNQISMQPFSR